MDKSIKAIFIIVSLLALGALGLLGLGDALFPLLMSFALSYLLFPVIKKMESKGIKRSLAVFAVFSVLILLLGLVVAVALPILINDTKAFITELPTNSLLALQKIEKVLSRFGYPIDLSKDSILSYLNSHIPEISSGLLKGITEGIKTSFSSILSWILALLNLFLIPLFFFYVINDYEKISESIQSFIPKSIIPKLTHYFKLTNEVLSGYIRGQLMVALALGVLYSLGLAIVGLRFGILIGLISGLLSIIPYVGFTVGFLTAIIMTLANYTGIGPLLGVVAVFLIVQALESAVITPKLVGDKVGLSSLATILALIIGGNLLGMVGMLLAIPVAAICKTLIRDLKAEYQELEFYKN